jgi:hypothetical protein
VNGKIVHGGRFYRALRDVGNCRILANGEKVILEQGTLFRAAPFVNRSPHTGEIVNEDRYEIADSLLFLGEIVVDGALVRIAGVPRGNEPVFADTELDEEEEAAWMLALLSR